jgi:hypothetical protein
MPTGISYSVANAKASSRQSGWEKGFGPPGNIFSIYSRARRKIAGKFSCLEEVARITDATREKGV